MDTLTKDGERRRSPQRVFVHDQLSVKYGIPASVVGCPFICDIEHDRTDENAYLYDLYDGTFRKHRLISPPGWMDRKRRSRHGGRLASAPCASPFLRLPPS